MRWRAAGSSPLTRGKRKGRGLFADVGGLIPAHAGKTGCPRAWTRSGAAHPRSRGENPVTVLRLSAYSGSSPLTRGKPAVRNVGVHVRGLIPAHAGKTQRARSIRRRRRAHPRSRGENSQAEETLRPRTGSSPLTRGKLVSTIDQRVGERLIPAHAGKTSRRMHPRTSAPAHPRSRGENPVAGECRARRDGSSPLTRGKHGCRGRSLVGLRLIPAHAGKTSPCRASRGRSPAHPRSRGENPTWRTGALTAWGSSPLTRGKHSLTCAFIKRIGQILESLELCASSGNYSLMDAYATDAPQDQARNTGLAPPSSRAAS